MSTAKYSLLPLDGSAYHDAGDERLAFRLWTQPSPSSGKVVHFSCLLDAESGKTLVRELAKALAQKFPDEAQRLTVDRP